MVCFIIGTSIEHFYPPVMHYGLRSGETICRRTAQVMVALGLDKRLWLNALKRVARKVGPNDENTIRFSENGILTLFQYFRTFLKESNITGLRFQILDDFGCGLYQLYPWLMKTPPLISLAKNVTFMQGAFLVFNLFKFLALGQ